MYEYLDGELQPLSPTAVVVDVAGVGYHLAVPLGAFASPGRARVWTHLVVREDAHRLYGFPDRESRDLFRHLLGVRGVGPALALGLLSGLPRDELVEAIAAGDARRLSRVKGVGKRTAEQILLDLGDRAADLRRELVGEAPRPETGVAASLVEDAVSALLSIGYTEKEARRNVEKVAATLDSPDLEQLVRAAIVA